MADTETTTAPETASPSLDSLSSDQLSHWRMTGELPSAAEPPSTPNADSSPAEPAEQAASTDASLPPASEPGKSSQTSNKNAETRKPELESDIQTLLAQRRELREEIARLEGQRRPAEPTPKAASEPASAPTLDTTINRPDIAKPALTEAEFFQAFPDASYGQFSRYVARYELASDRAQAREAEQRERQTQTVIGRATSYRERMAAAKAADPSFVPDARLGALRPLDVLGPNETPTALNVIAQELLVSELAPQMTRYLTEHPEEFDRLAGLTSQDAIVRAFGKLEAKLESPSAPVPPPTKNLSSAPPPPSTLGRKPALPADEVDSALASGDVGRYIAEMNRREMASR